MCPFTSKQTLPSSQKSKALAIMQNDTEIRVKAQPLSRRYILGICKERSYKRVYC